MKSISDQYHNKWRWLTDLLLGEDDKANITKGQAQKIKNDEIKKPGGENNHSVKADVRDLLSLFEHLSVAVNSGVFDFNILAKMSSDYLIRRFEIFQEYMELVIMDDETKIRHAEYFIEFYRITNRLRYEKDLELVAWPGTLYSSVPISYNKITTYLKKIIVIKTRKLRNKNNIVL
jgi:hypothetical protein